MRTLFSAFCLLAILVNIPASAQRVSPTAPSANRGIVAPGSQRPPADHPQSAAGTIEGFVYWDANSITHKPASSCSGLALTVSVGSSSGGPLTAYTPIGTLSNNFKYVGQVKTLLAGGKVNIYDVCTYGYDHVPVGPDLQVSISVQNPLLFSPYVAPQNATLGPIQIINAKCNMLPSLNPSTIADLTAHWGSCQNRAYDVNFLLQPSSHILSGGPGLSSGPSGTAIGMLSGGPQQGMLSPGTTQSAQNSAKSGTLLGNSQVAPGQGAKVSGTALGQKNLGTLAGTPAIKFLQWPLPDPFASGTITGFVYWDTRSTQHNPAGSCSGLTLTVMLGDGAKPRERFQTFRTFSDNFIYMDASNQYAQYLVAPGWVAACAYAVSLPQSYVLATGPTPKDVVVKVTSNSSAFTAQVTPLANTQYPLRVSDLECPLFPIGYLFPGVKADSCQYVMFNVNFALQGPTPLAELAPSAVAAASVSGGRSRSGSAQPGAQVLLGNSDVVELAKRGLPESVIIYRIQSAQKKFDFSPAACRELQQAHVSRNVLTAMGDGSAPPCPTIQGNSTPQTDSSAFAAGAKPGGSGGFAGGGGASSFAPSTTSINDVPTMPPMNSTPKRDAAATADTATKTQIKSKLEAQLRGATQRTQRSANVALKPADGKSSEIQVLQSQIMFVNSLRTSGAPTNGTLIPAQAPNLRVRNQPAAPSNPMLHAPEPSKICLTPQIHAVNDKSSGVIFTQDPAYNDYVITGCGFGTQGGQVYLSGAVTGGRINLVVKPNQWSDTQIEAVVEPGLTGVLDGWPDLIVVPSGGSSAKFPNCRFYAQRQSVLLPDIPQQYATLANVTVGDSTHGFGTLYCPGPDTGHLFPCVAYNAGPPLDGITNGHDHRNDPNELVSNAVDRDGGQLQFNAGEDVYDLSSMAPGFLIDSSIVYWYAWTSDVCEGWSSDAFPKKAGDSIGYDTEGTYRWYMKTNTKIVVDWGVDHCAWRWLGIFKVDDWYNSGYSLQVYVKGPIGVDPWTGHPVSTTRNFGQALPNKVARVP